MIPTSGKAEWHITYRCSLACTACNRASWLREPHTDDMTLEDAREFCRQADEIGWKKLVARKHHPRIIIIGGEPTLHPEFLEFVRLAKEWSGTFVEVFSNGLGAARRKLKDADRKHGAVIETSTFKRESVRTPEDFQSANWWMHTYVSPSDAGLPSPPCYAHPSKVCGISVDHDGYALCSMGGAMRTLRGLPRTKNLADLFEPSMAKQMTASECQHCGFEYFARDDVTAEQRAAFAEYADQQPITEHGCAMSPTWQRAFANRRTK